MHRKIGLGLLLILTVIMLLLSSCSGYSETSSVSKCSSGPSGGTCEFRAKRANGSVTKDVELSSFASGGTVAVDVVLSLEAGSYKIELLGEGDAVTATIEANGGESVGGRGEMAVDSFGEASFRVTAVEAQGVEYTMTFLP